MLSKYEYYKSIGLSVIPLIGKSPIIKGWDKFNLELPSESDIKIFKEFYENSNIGLCLGVASGVMCIDIDTDRKLTLDSIPKSPFVKRGKKGETRFFKYNPKIQSAKFLSKGVEIFAHNGQTVLPPSIHPETGEPYVWIGEYTFDVGNFRDLLPQLDSILFINDLTTIREVNDTEYAGRNERLKTIAHAAYVDGHSLSEIINKILQFDKNEFKNNQLFLDINEPYYKKTKDQRNAAELFATSVIESAVKNNVKPLNLNSVVVVNEKELKNESKLDKQLPKLTGLLEKIAFTYEQTSYVSQKPYAYCSAIMLISTLCLGRFKFQGVPTNLYSLIVGKSSSGKESIKNFFHNVLNHYKLEKYNLLGLSNYASKPAAIIGLPKQRFRIDIVDELGSLFMQYKNKNNSQSEIFNMLNDMWSMPLKKFHGIKAITRGNDTGECWNPHINFLGMIQPEIFKNSVNELMISDGFIPRMLMFKSEGVPNPNREVQFDEKYFDFLVDQIFGHFDFEKPVLRDIHIIGVSGDEQKTNEGSKRAILDELLINKAAMQYFIELSDNYIKLKRTAEKNDSIELELISKCDEIIKKLAMVHCISRNDRELNIADFEFANAMFEYSFEHSIDLVSNLHDMPKTYNSVMFDKVEKFLKVYKKATYRDIINKFRISKKQVDDIINILEDSELISKKEIANQNNTKTIQVIYN